MDPIHFYGFSDIYPSPIFQLNEDPDPDPWNKRKKNGVKTLNFKHPNLNLKLDMLMGLILI